MSDPFFPRDDAEFYKGEYEKLLARLERVKALPEKWRRQDKIGIRTVSGCADELKEALK